MPQVVTLRTRYRGFTTDISGIVDISAIDVDPCTGAETDRFYGSATPEENAPKGRWRFEPNNRIPAYLPPTREVRAVSQTGVLALANGLVSGQYRLPNQVYIFQIGR